MSYPAAKFVPHQGKMRLIDTIESISEDSVSVSLIVREDGFFNEGKQVPSWVGIEYMAQSIAAHSGYHTASQGKDIKVGFLLGTRRFHSNNDFFSCGDSITISATLILQGENGIGSFSCHLSGTNIEQNAILTVYQPQDTEAFVKEENQCQKQFSSQDQAEV